MAFGGFAYVFFKSPIFLLLQRVKREKTLLIITKICNSKLCILLLPSVARQHTILNTRWFLQSPLDPVFRAIYVLSKSRSCVCLSGFRISGEIISFKYLNYFEGGGRESFSIAHACFLPCAREQDEKSRFLKTNGKRWKIFRKIR